MTRGPTIVRVAPGGGGGARGIKCCCCRCCECFNLGYLTTQHGLIKLAEAVSTYLYYYMNFAESCLLNILKQTHIPGARVFTRINLLVILRNEFLFLNIVFGVKELCRAM